MCSALRKCRRLCFIWQTERHLPSLQTASPKNLYRQLAELNGKIAQREQGQRFPNAAEADTISKLANAIKKMETEVGLADITSVFADLLKWLRTYDAEQAKQVCPLLDAFVKSKLA